MVDQIRYRDKKLPRPIAVVIIILVIIGAAIFGFRSSTLLLLAFGGIVGAAIMLRKPFTGLIALVIVALLAPFEIGTGTEVSLNPTVVVIPVLFAIWILYVLVRPDIRLVRSPSFIPLILFLVSGLLSLLIGNILWNPLVPKSPSFIMVQLAQWSIFALSGLTYFLAGNLIDSEKRLRWLVMGFMVIGGILSILVMLFNTNILVGPLATMAIGRTPFWILLTSVAGGQLLFNRKLSRSWRALALLSLTAAIFYAFVQHREAVSNWVGVSVVILILIWLRWPRLRIPAVVITALLVLTGILTQTLWNFGGGDTEWITSGASRIALAERVLEVSMANPITGLGPAAYRNYAATTPLAYGKAFWVNPSINSHNNYIDIFSQTGLLGLGLFLWFLISLLVLTWRLIRQHQSGFVSGYLHAMIATWVSIMAIMMLLDWFLPFVYNVGFPGFQASVLIWLFFGGLLSVESFKITENKDHAQVDIEAQL